MVKLCESICKLKELWFGYLSIGNALATTFPYFRKITNGSTLEVKGHFKIYCLFSEGVMNEASGWYNSSVLQVPEVPSVDYLMKSKKDVAAREFVLMTNQYVSSFANNGTYTCDPLGRGTNKLSVYLKPSPSKHAWLKVYSCIVHITYSQTTVLDLVVSGSYIIIIINVKVHMCRKQHYIHTQ